MKRNAAYMPHHVKKAVKKLDLLREKVKQNSKELKEFMSEHSCIIRKHRNITFKTHRSKSMLRYMERDVSSVSFPGCPFLAVREEEEEVYDSD